MNTFDEELDYIFGQYPQSLRKFKNNSPTAYSIFKTAIKAATLRHIIGEDDYVIAGQIGLDGIRRDRKIELDSSRNDLRAEQRAKLAIQDMKANLNRGAK